MWDGYLDTTSGWRLSAMLESAGVHLHHLHTSGHASVPDLQRLVDALAPRRVVPIHSEGGDREAELFPRVDRQTDSAWWQVA
jgi:ribonuclease J